MARYSGPVCRLCRREKVKLFLKGERCNTKCPIDKKKFGPGVAIMRRKQMSEYGVQLREKQKVRRYYGLLEVQFKKLFVLATKMSGATGSNFLSLLEMRLDNVVYRMGFAESRKQARQLVNHGNVLLNGRRVTIPSCIVKENDVVAMPEGFKENPMVKRALEGTKQNGVKPWLDLDADKLTGKVLKKPGREDIDLEVEENLIVEFFSR